MQYTTKQLQEIYKSLPEDLKDAIWSAESAAIIQSIGKKYGLNVEQTGKLASETGLVLLGLTHPKDYIKILSGRVAVDIDTARKIAEEVNNGIFSKVKEYLKKLHGIDAGIASGAAPEKEKKPQESIPPLFSSEVRYPNPSPPKITLELPQKHEPEKYGKDGEQKPPAPVLPESKISVPMPANLEQTAPKTPAAPQIFSKPAEPSGLTPPSPAPRKLELEPAKQTEAPIGASKYPEQKAEAKSEPVKPAETPLIFHEKIKEEPKREQSQTVEIEPSIPKNYEKGNDPYKEPFN